MNVSRVARMSGESISATSNGSFFRGGRTSMKIWSSDRAAWPVIGVTMLGCAFTTVYGCNLIFRHPDVMFDKDTRSVHIRDNQEHGTSHYHHPIRVSSVQRLPEIMPAMNQAGVESRLK